MTEVGAIDNDKMPKRHTALDLLNAGHLAAAQARNQAIDDCKAIVDRYAAQGDWDADTLAAIRHDIEALKPTSSGEK